VYVIVNFLQGATIVNQAVTISEVDYFPGDANTQTSHVREFILKCFHCLFPLMHEKYFLKELAGQFL
jgi:hypothetical protein